jgi:RNA polymerase sigma-70 factor (ECF subfamily)
VDDLSDEELMARVMRGDRDALTPLAVRYHRPLLGYLYRLTGGQLPLAEDLVQETFVRLLNQRSYRPGRAFRPWLYAVATNVARDHFRSPAARRAGELGDALAVSLRDGAPGPEERALRAEEGRAVRQALARLSEEQRVTLFLRFYQGLSLAEIAATLETPLGTVKSRLFAALRRLRDLLVETGAQAEELE